MDEDSGDLDRLESQIAMMSAMDALAWATGALRRLSAHASIVGLPKSVRFVERWLRAPDEPGRLAALEQAERLGYDGVEGWLFAAIAWSSGSMVDPRVSVVEAPAGLSVKATTAAVLTALQAETDDTFRESMVRTFLNETAQR